MTPLLLALGTLFTSAGVAPPAEDAFVCSAEPLELLEGGPATIRLTLKYRGDLPISVMSSCLAGLDPYVEVTAPKSWGQRGPRSATSGKMSIEDISDGISIGPAPLPCQVKPGASFHTIVHLHHRFANVPAGTSKLSVRWELVLWRGDERTSLSTSTDITLEVPAASPERVQMFRTRLMDRLTDKSLDVLGRRSFVNQVRYCKHPELLAVLYTLLGRDDRDCSVDARPVQKR
jgi:hypothetical protein